MDQEERDDFADLPEVVHTEEEPDEGTKDRLFHECRECGNKVTVILANSRVRICSRCNTVANVGFEIYQGSQSFFFWWQGILFEEDLVREGKHDTLNQKVFLKISGFQYDFISSLP